MREWIRGKKLGNMERSVEEYGEKLSGARKEMLREVTEYLEQATVERFVSLDFYDVVPRPNLVKLVDRGLLREKDAAVVLALYMCMQGTGKPKAVKYSWARDQEIAAWARNAATLACLMKDYLQYGHMGRDRMREDMRSARGAGAEPVEGDIAGEVYGYSLYPYLIDVLEDYDITSMKRVERFAPGNYWRVKDDSGREYIKYGGAFYADEEGLVGRIRGELGEFC